MDISIAFIIGAAICFGLGAFRVPAAVNWTDGGFCLLTIALFLL